MTHSFRSTFLVGLALTVCAGFLALAPSGCGRSTPPPIGPAKYVGNDACAPCHAEEFKKHHGGRHDRSLQLATASELGGLKPAVGPVPGTRLKLDAQGDDFVLRGPGNPDVKFDLVLGSGKVGITFVSLHDDGTLTESAQSWIPSEKRWYKTPGQEYADAEQTGQRHPADASRKCLTCHTVTIPEQSLMPERRFFGVGCETCHGPGSAHIEAAKRKDPNLLMKRLQDLTPREINEECGKCHRSFDGVGAGGIEVTMTNRFQAYGLMQSPCFEKGGEKLSCLTCHDPHDNLETNPRHYDIVCMTCHSPGAKLAPPEVPQERAEFVCPVNPNQKCTSCHMPKRKVFPKSNIFTNMADHLIWAYGRKNPRKEGK